LGTTSCAGATAQKIIKRGGVNFYSPVKTGKTIKWGFFIFFPRGLEKILGNINIGEITYTFKKIK